MHKATLKMLFLLCCGCQSGLPQTPAAVPTPVPTSLPAARPALPPREGLTISTYCLSAQGRSVVLACLDGLRQLDLQSGKVQAFYPTPVEGLSFLTDCDGEVRLLTLNSDALSLTQLREGRCQTRLLFKQPEVMLVRADTQRLTPIAAWDSARSQVNFWHFQDGNLLAGALPFKRFKPVKLMLGADEGTIFLSPPQGEAVQLNLGFKDPGARPPNPPLPDTIKPASKRVSYVISPNGDWVAVAEGGSVKIFDPKDGRVLATLATSEKGPYLVRLAGQNLLVGEPVGFSVWDSSNWKKRFWHRYAWTISPDVTPTDRGYLAVNQRKAVLCDVSDGHPLWSFPPEVVSRKPRPGGKTTPAQAQRFAGGWHRVSDTHDRVDGDSHESHTPALLFCIRSGCLDLRTSLSPSGEQPVQLQLPLTGQTVDFEMNETGFVGSGLAQLDSGTVRLQFDQENPFQRANPWKDCLITREGDLLKLSFLNKSGVRAVQSYRRIDGLSTVNAVESRSQTRPNLSELGWARAFRRSGQVHFQFCAKPGKEQPVVLEIVSQSIAATPEDRLSVRAPGFQPFDCSEQVRLFRDGCGQEYVSLYSSDHTGEWLNSDFRLSLSVFCPLEAHQSTGTEKDAAGSNPESGKMRH